MGSKSHKKSPSPLLDLHGFRTDEIFEAVEGFLNRHQSKNTVYIMPGKGTGKVKAKVVEYLKMAGYPYSVYRGENGTPNEGVLAVHMD